MACEVVCRVVSLAATASSTKKAAISGWVSRSPSISASTRAVMRSSCGEEARSAASPVAYSCSVPRPWPSRARGSSRAMNSGSDALMSRSAASTTRSRSASATPNISDQVISGRRLAIRSTKSPPPVGAASSTTSRAFAAMPSSMRATWRGENAFWTSPRSLVCRGASIARKDCEASSISSGASANWTPCPEQNRSGSREIERTSS